jgi:hypothetical protein
MVTFQQLLAGLLKHPDRLSIQIQLENEFPLKWAQWLTDHPFTPIDHGQKPEHYRAGYGSKNYWGKQNPG